ncbi:MAG TPA: hypothetical protein VFW11_01720 [Cyclobacteriaceae bacterium]|nr:hypothetical protein [Cyclobacteriaceae bacterium]
MGKKIKPTEIFLLTLLKIRPASAASVGQATCRLSASGLIPLQSMLNIFITALPSSKPFLRSNDFCNSFNDSFVDDSFYFISSVSEDHLILLSYDSSINSGQRQG